MRPIAIIQARLDSTRLPGKVLRPIVGRPMLLHIIERVRAACGLEGLVVATSEEDSDAPIRELCRSHEVQCFSGSKTDVLDRFYRAASEYGGDPIIRVTGDCPFVDPQLIERVIEFGRAGDYDHLGLATGAGASFMQGGRFPDGLDLECFRYGTLAEAWKQATSDSDREHVTPYIWKHPDRFKLGTLKADRDYSDLRWTVDTAADLEMVERVYEGLFKADPPFLMADILKFLEENPEVSVLNREQIGLEGYGEIWADEDEKGLVEQ
jgi:spore coat polysaccharide biosynthesis protein SpsF